MFTIKFAKKEEGYGIKEIQKQFRVSKSNNEALKKLAKYYSRSEADILNEFLYIESKKIENLEKIEKNLTEKKVCSIYNNQKFIGYFPENEKDSNGQFILNQWQIPVIKNRLGYEVNKLIIKEAFNSSFKYSVEYYKEIYIYASITEPPLYQNYFTQNFALENEKELLNLLEELNFDPYNVVIN